MKGVAVNVERLKFQRGWRHEMSKLPVLSMAVLLVILAMNSTSKAANVLYTTGHTLDTARLATFGGHTLLATFGNTDAGWAAALGGSFGSFDAIIVGEGSNPASLSATTRTNIAAYVSGGGRIIVIGSHGGLESAFLNSVFSYSTTVAFGCGFGGGLAGSLQPAAAGTSFAGGPATVGNMSCTTHLTTGTTPGITMYAGVFGALVFMDQVGAGLVGFLGWDFCCDGTPGQQDDWYRVMDSALLFTTNVCGNGVKEGSEGCDDGNTASGDCCSSTCVVEPAGTVCNPGSGDLCDPDETCDGVGPTCPADVVEPAVTVCNPGSGDLCDPDEFCPGVADAACPADIVAPNTTVCNPGTGDLCDPDELCPGVADAACPADGFEPATTVCNAGTGDLCDPDELCPGVADAACPADGFEPDTTVCNPGSGDLCDPDEFCPGMADEACPADFFQDEFFVCADTTCTGIPDEACPVLLVESNAFPYANGFGCRHEVINEGIDKNIDIDVFAICASGGSTSDSNEVCICISRDRFNGFNATGTRLNGSCPSRSQYKFCFEEDPLFWKVQVDDTCRNVFVENNASVECPLDCPDDKMVLSCGGRVQEATSP